MKSTLYVNVVFFAVVCVAAFASADTDPPCGGYGPAYWVNAAGSVSQTVTFGAPLAVHYFGYPLFGACNFSEAKSGASLSFTYNKNGLVTKAVPHNTQTASLAGLTNTYQTNGLIDTVVIDAAKGHNDISHLTIKFTYDPNSLNLVEMDFTGDEAAFPMHQLMGVRYSSLLMSTSVLRDLSAFTRRTATGQINYKRTYEYADSSSLGLPTKMVDGFNNSTTHYAYTYTKVGDRQFVAEEKVSVEGGESATFKYEYNSAGLLTKSTCTSSGSDIVNINTYDSKGRLLTMHDGTGATVIKMAYPATGNEVSYAYLGSKINQWTFAYDN